MSIHCEACREALVDYHYGEQPRKERRETAEHLASCPDCAMEYCRLGAALGGIVEAVGEEVRPEVHASLRARVEAEFRPPWWRRFWRLGTFPIPAYQTALLVIVALLAWVLLAPQPVDRPRPRGDTVTIIDNYDASELVSLDPDLL